jgi:hypothetical protein
LLKLPQQFYYLFNNGFILGKYVDTKYLIMNNLTQWELRATIINMTNSHRNIVAIANIAEQNKEVFDGQCGNAILWAVNFFPSDEPNFKEQLKTDLSAYKTILALCNPVCDFLGFGEKIRFEMLGELIEKIEKEIFDEKGQRTTKEDDAPK